MDGTRILLCEDDKDIRWALSKVMRQHGAEVVEAPNGAEGLKFLSKGRYDVLISDVAMPQMGGFGLFASLRFGAGDAYSEHRHMPIVLMSGQTSGGEIARGLDAGVDEFLSKPIDPMEFVARIRVVIRRARSSGTTSSRTQGSLIDFGIFALTQALHLAGRSARVRIQRGLESAFFDVRTKETLKHVLQVVGSIGSRADRQVK